MKEKNDIKESLVGFLKERKEEKEKFEALVNKLNSGTATMNELNYLFFFRNSFTAEMSNTIVNKAEKVYF